MAKIDILSAQGVDEGASPRQGGFSIEVPWGKYHLGEIDLEDGWYEFIADCPGASLTLYDHKNFNLIELTAAFDTPSYIRLTKGCYRISFVPGARSGFYPLKSARFRELSKVRRFFLLAGRFAQAVNAGVSPGQIAKMVKLAFSKRTYGMRASATSPLAKIGALSAADQARDLHDPILGIYDKRVARLSDGPVFLVRDQSGANLPPEFARTQVYQRYTVSPEEPHDYILTVAAGDVLTPDALLNFAEHIRRNPTGKVILADVWSNNAPTARVAWDPLVYSDGLPTPFVHAAGLQFGATWKNEADFSVISVPLATSPPSGSFARDLSVAPSRKIGCSVIIPTRDRADLLAKCLSGLFEQTSWLHEVIVVDNGSVEEQTFELFDRYGQKGLKVLRSDIPFNFSTLCNIGAEAAAYSHFAFLNNDVVLHRSDWLEQMMRLATRPEIGAVGARLLYADGRLQHGGVALGLTQLCGHMWRGMPRHEQDLEPRLSQTSLRSAVTAACLVVGREKFEQVGGFDSEKFPVTLNDIDLCMKLRLAGFYNAYCASAEAYHLEGESRGEDRSGEKLERRRAELAEFKRSWCAEISSDPWFPVCLSRQSEACAAR